MKSADGPSNRMSARVDPESGSSLVSHGSSPVSGYDRLRTLAGAHPLRAGSVRSGVALRLRAGLSERDLGVLGSVRALRLMSVEQIRRLHFTDHHSPEASARASRRVLKRLSDQELLFRLERRIGGIRAGSAGHVYALTSLGHRVLGSVKRHRRTEPSLGFVNHTLAIAEMASCLIADAERLGVEVLGASPEPFCWRHPTGTRTKTAATALVKPDLAVVVADQRVEMSWFIEVDLGTESVGTVARKCRAYSSYYHSGIEQNTSGVFPKILWVAPDQHRADQIRRAIAREGIEPELFAIATRHQALAVICALEDQP